MVKASRFLEVVEGVSISDSECVRLASLLTNKLAHVSILRIPRASLLAASMILLALPSSLSRICRMDKWLY
jgi:hypothetical protein